MCDCDAILIVTLTLFFFLSLILVVELAHKNEAIKVVRLKDGLLKLSEAYVELANKCAIIFEAQRVTINISLITFYVDLVWIEIDYYFDLICSVCGGGGICKREVIL